MLLAATTLCSKLHCQKVLDLNPFFLINRQVLDLTGPDAERAGRALQEMSNLRSAHIPTQTIFARKSLRKCNDFREEPISDDPKDPAAGIPKGFRA